MKLLEVELGDDFRGQRNAIIKFDGRNVILKDEHRGWIHGKIGEQEKESYRFSANGYRGDHRGEDNGNCLLLNYRDLKHLILINPKQDDERKVNHAYQEVTEQTIATTKKWADRGYRV